ncbi:MAG TPA: indole-3-glycerol-phosphate synthase [Nitrososphaerales archaeon]|nr:indole-3-glycerol-phosphate synthase [Nitrososphaerales archaeon]
MAEFLKKLAESAKKAIDDGIYDIEFTIYRPTLSIKDAIRNCKHTPIITEIKFASPSMGTIRQYSDPTRIAREMVDSGAIALSILTQPNMFDGSIEYLVNARLALDVPLLMKDIMISDVQIDAAKKIGADCILLIASLFNANLCEGSIERFIDKAHKNDLEVLLETHTEDEFRQAMLTNADLIGINNRNLDTMKIDIKTTEYILKRCEKTKPVISESGISKAEQIKYLKSVGADAFLIGTGIMQSNNIKDKVKELVVAV